MRLQSGVYDETYGGCKEIMIFKNETEFVQNLIIYIDNLNHIAFPQNSRMAHRNTRYKSGTPDILVLSNMGQFWGVEAKMEKGVLSKTQKGMMQQFKEIDYKERFLVVRPSNYKELLEKIK